MTKHILKTTLWFAAGSCVAIGFGADGGMAMLGGAVWVWIFA